MRKAMMAAMLLFPLWLGAQTTGRVVWKVIFQVPYPYELSDDFYTAPIYVNGRKVTKQTRNIVESFTAEYSFEVKDGDSVEYRVEDPTEVNFHYEIRDHLDRLMACRNPSSPFIGESPEPVKVILKHGGVPGHAAFKIPVDGDTAYPLTGILEWTPPDYLSEFDCYDTSVSPQKLIQGYRVYWGKTGQEMELISEQSAALCWTMLAPMEPDTEYHWKVVPFNEQGEAQGCPTWKYRTALFTRVARFNDFGCVADVDGDGCLDFLYMENNLLSDGYDGEDDHFVIGYFRGYTGRFVVLVDGYLESLGDRVTWLDVDQDGDLDVVCYNDENEGYFFDNEYDFNDYAEEALDVKVFLNGDGLFDDKPVTGELRRKYLIKSLHQAIKDSLPDILMFVEKNGEIDICMAMDADGDGDKDLLPVVKPYSQGDSSETPQLLPEYYSTHALDSEFGMLRILLNRSGEIKSDSLFDEEASDSQSRGGLYHWADFDLDGDADLCITVETGNYGIGLCDIFRNNSGNLVPLNQALSGYDALDPSRESNHVYGRVYYDIYWYDIDGDSDPDLIHKNSNGEFEGDTYYLYLNQTIRNE